MVVDANKSLAYLFITVTVYTKSRVLGSKRQICSENLSHLVNIHDFKLMKNAQIDSNLTMVEADRVRWLIQIKAWPGLPYLLQ